jgi:hypothetical protein
MQDLVGTYHIIDSRRRIIDTYAEEKCTLFAIQYFIMRGGTSNCYGKVNFNSRSTIIWNVAPCYPIVVYENCFLQQQCICLLYLLFDASILMKAVRFYGKVGKLTYCTA